MGTLDSARLSFWEFVSAGALAHSELATQASESHAASASTLVMIMLSMFFIFFLGISPEGAADFHAERHAAENCQNEAHGVSSALVRCVCQGEAGANESRRISFKVGTK